MLRGLRIGLLEILLRDESSGELHRSQVHRRAEAIINRSGRLLSLLLQKERRNRRGTGVITPIVTSVVATISKSAGHDLVTSVAVRII